MAGCRYCGLPAVAPPLRCGVLAYLHIPKTGGSSVTQFLQRHTVGGRGWSLRTINAQYTWSHVLEQIQQQQSRPKMVVVHHVDAGTAISDPRLLADVLEPLDCHLRKRGCRLVRATVLRDAVARATSAAFFNGVPHDLYAKWIAEHAADGTIAFLLANRMKVGGDHRVTSGHLQIALRALARFEAVGRTEELGAFLAHISRLLGWPSALSDPDNVPSANPTPSTRRYELSHEEYEWTSNHTMLDAQLVASLCIAGGSGRAAGYASGASQQCYLEHVWRRTMRNATICARTEAEGLRSLP
jgi:hypothetical protein